MLETRPNRSSIGRVVLPWFRAAWPGPHGQCCAGHRLPRAECALGRTSSPSGASEAQVFDSSQHAQVVPGHRSRRSQWAEPALHGPCRTYCPERTEGGFHGITLQDLPRRLGGRQVSSASASTGDKGPIPAASPRGYPLEESGVLARSRCQDRPSSISGNKPKFGIGRHPARPLLESARSAT